MIVFIASVVVSEETGTDIVFTESSSPVPEPPRTVWKPPSPPPAGDLHAFHSIAFHFLFSSLSFDDRHARRSNFEGQMESIPLIPQWTIPQTLNYKPLKGSSNSRTNCPLLPPVPFHPPSTHLPGKTIFPVYNELPTPQKKVETSPTDKGITLRAHLSTSTVKR